MATLDDLAKVIAPMGVDALTNLFAQSAVIVDLTQQQNKIDKMMAGRDAASKAANDAIAVAQAALAAAQLAQKQAAK